MIKLRIITEEGGFFTRVLLYDKDHRTGDISIPVYDEGSQLIRFRKLTREEQDEIFTYSTVVGKKHPFEILQVSDRCEDGGGRAMIQSLLDDLWQNGFRPSNSVDRTDTIKAQDQHISDLNEARKELADIAKSAIARIPSE